MIVRVWGSINDIPVEFSPLKERPGYWEGYAPRAFGYQKIEIWAENDKGVRALFRCSMRIECINDSLVRVLLSPYVTRLIEAFSVKKYEDRRVRLV